MGENLSLLLPRPLWPTCRSLVVGRPVRQSFSVGGERIEVRVIIYIRYLRLHPLHLKLVTSKKVCPCLSTMLLIYIIDKNLTLHYNTSESSGSGSVVERHLAKVNVAGSTPVSRSFYCRRHSQTVRRRSAKPLFIGSTPFAALYL